MYKMLDKLFIVEERGALIVNYDKNDASNTEYIRKDAVLDLLNEEKEKTSIGVISSTNGIPVISECCSERKEGYQLQYKADIHSGIRMR